MATNYSFEYRGSIIPKEKPTLVDGVDTTTVIYSKVDKVLGGSKSVSVGSTATELSYASTDTDTGGQTIQSLLTGPTGDTTNFLAVFITAAASTGTPDASIAIDGTNYEIKLSGVGDFCIIPLTPQAIGTAKIKSAGSTTLATVDILYKTYTA